MLTSTRLIPLLSAPETPACFDAPALLAAVRESDPAAAMSLYELYGGILRHYLRHHAGVREVEQPVYTILLEAARAARRSAAMDLNELNQIISGLARQALLALMQPAPPRTLRVADLPAQARNELIGALLKTLEPHERAVLLRSSLLYETDREISDGVAIPIEQVDGARAKARVYLEAWSYPIHDYEFDPAAIA